MVILSCHRSFLRSARLQAVADVELDEAITNLADRDPVSAELVKLRFFAGMSLKEAAEALGLTRRQGDRHWAYARAWLFDRLRND